MNKPKSPFYERRARVLVIDDQAVIIQLINNILAPEHDVFMATSGEQALNLIADIMPDLILMDVVMPGMDGLQLCHLLKQQPDTKNIPVIFVTTLQSPEGEEACWEAGGVDFVNKPINAVTLRNRVNVHLRLMFQTEQLRELAFVDGLTGIANRRRFDERLDLDFRRCQRIKKPLALLMLDVDLFKRYNDRYGHQKGDVCLQKIAKVLQQKLRRPGDLAARYGGEEFICLLPETDDAGARQIAEELLLAIKDLGIEHLDSNVAPVVTVSIGVAVLTPSSDSSPASLLAEADARLYEAKQQGRNCVIGVTV